MSDLTAACLWCVLQVTFVGLLTAGVYLGVRRRAPELAAMVLLAGLTLPIFLSAAMFSPWPSWIHMRPGEMSAIDEPVSLGYETSTTTAAAAPPAQPVLDTAIVPPDVDSSPESTAIIPAERMPSASTRGSVAQPANRLASWARCLPALVVIALAAGILRLLIGWLAITRLVSRSRVVKDAGLNAVCDTLCRLLAYQRGVEMRESDRLTTAAMIGGLRTVLLLPSDWRSWTDDERRAVLAHELAHAAQRHFGTWMLAQCGLSLHVYHPLLHWLAGRLRLEQEYEADALAAKVTGGSAAYLRTLAQLALQQPEAPLTWPARAFLARPGTVVRRIQELQAPRQERPSRILFRAGVVLLVLCGTIAAAGFRPPAPTGEHATRERVEPSSDDEIVENALTPDPAPVLAAVGADDSRDNPSQEHVVITGRVTDPDGNPAAGAIVVLPINYGWGGERRDVAQGVADSAGMYSLQVPMAWLTAPTRYYRMRTLWTYQSGYALASADVSSQLDTSKPPQPVDLQLPPESPVTYRIIDENGQPLTDGDVEILNYHSAVADEYVPLEILERLPVTRDADGNATIAAIETGHLSRISVRTDRHGKQSFRADALPEGGQFQLRDAAPVRGRIVGQNPDWVKNVSLFLLSQSESGSDFTAPRGEAEVRTDDDGRFLAPLLARGRLTVMENGLDDGLPVRLEIPNRNISVPRDTPLEFRLIPAQRVRGKVVRRDDGTPVAGVKVLVAYGRLQSDHVVTGANGEFEAGVVPGSVQQWVGEIPDENLVQVPEPGNERIDVPASGVVFSLPTIELVRTYVRTAQLVDDAGQPLVKWTVCGVAGNRRYGFAETDGNGTAQLRLPAGVTIEQYTVFSPTEDAIGRGVVVTENPLVLRPKLGQRWRPEPKSTK